MLMKEYTKEHMDVVSSNLGFFSAYLIAPAARTTHVTAIYLKLMEQIQGYWKANRTNMIINEK